MPGATRPGTCLVGQQTGDPGAVSCSLSQGLANAAVSSQMRGLEAQEEPLHRSSRTAGENGVPAPVSGRGNVLFRVGGRPFPPFGPRWTGWGGGPPASAAAAPRSARADTPRVTCDQRPGTRGPSGTASPTRLPSVDSRSPLGPPPAAGHGHSARSRDWASVSPPSPAGGRPRPGGRLTPAPSPPAPEDSVSLEKSTRCCDDACLRSLPPASGGPEPPPPFCSPAALGPRCPECPSYCTRDESRQKDTLGCHHPTCRLGPGEPVSALRAARLHLHQPHTVPRPSAM